MLKYSTVLTVLIAMFVLQVKTTDIDVKSHQKEIIKWQQELNHEFADSTESCLSAEDRAKFTGLDYYPITYKFRITAQFERTKNEKEFGMKTTTDRLPVYVRYGIASFSFEGKDYKINIYQNVKFAKTDKYKDYLFMLFNDKTSGVESYAGGRYIDLRIPKGNEIIIDFNKAYNPYCAYNHKYSCPIPPDDDYFDMEILAGCKKGFH
jgi:uncharacterized protein (DUF1684 family)